MHHNHFESCLNYTEHMRILVYFFVFLLFVTSCGDDEPGSDVSLGLQLSEKEVNELQQKFDMLLIEFAEVEAARDEIPEAEQTDVGFLYMDIMKGKLNTFDALLPGLNHLSVEDAVMIMFLLISQDAREDLKDMLENMDETNAKKKTLLDKTLAFSETLSSFGKELNDVYLYAQDKQPVMFTDTTIALVNLVGNRPASFIRNGQEGSITHISVSSSTGQTPPIILKLEDMATSEVLFTETISQDYDYSHTLKKKAALRISLFNTVSDHVVTVTVKIVHTKKVMKTPEAVDKAVGSVVRQLAEVLAAELDALYIALQELYNDQFISTAEAEALRVLTTLSVNRFNYASDVIKNPTIYKYPDKQDVISEMNEQDMYWLKKHMAKKESLEEKISAIMGNISDTQDQITQNLK